MSDDVRERALWDPVERTWLEWEPQEKRWVPARPRTYNELAAAGQMILDLLPNAVPTCSRCGVRMDDHIEYSTFGDDEIGIVCPLPDL